MALLKWQLYGRDNYRALTSARYIIFNQNIDLGVFFFFAKRLKFPSDHLRLTVAADGLRLREAIYKWKVTTLVFTTPTVHSDYERHWTATERAPPVY